MSGPTIGANQCEHGQLARVCEVCDLQARLAECERAKDDHFMNSCLRANIEVLAAENDTLRAQLAETQRLLEVQLAVGDKLTAEVARLTACLKKANTQTEEFERRYYLEQQAREDKEAELAALRAVVEKAPCGNGEVIWSSTGNKCSRHPLKCNCWKRDALGR